MSYEPVEPFILHRWEPRSFWLRRPRAVGTRFLIVKKDHLLPAPSAASGRIPILLEIRHAFGSGGHGSTEGCIVALEKAVHGGERVLDLGTGSGILAIASAKLGASHVTAVDISDSACRETHGNLLRNGIRDGAQVLHGGIESVGGRFDIVLANLRTPILVAIMEKIIEKVATNGIQIVSGIRESEFHPFGSFLRRFPLTPVETIGIRGWMTLVSRRSGTGEGGPYRSP
jgi:ribosomal protein L11 methyltransferase